MRPFWAQAIEPVNSHRGLARLKPGVTLGSAQADNDRETGTQSCIGAANGTTRQIRARPQAGGEDMELSCEIPTDIEFVFGTRRRCRSPSGL